MNPLIARYVHQVRTHQGDDVAREIESLIGDTLEHRSQGKPATEELIVDVLTEFGDPMVAAADDRPQGPMLIRHDLLPSFFRSVGWTPFGLGCLWLLLFELSNLPLAVGRREILSASNLGNWIVSYATVVLLNLGGLVIAFVLISRFSSLPVRPRAAFDPRTLPQVPVPADADRVSPGWTLAGACLLAALLIALNVVPRWLDLFSLTATDRGLVPLADLGIRVPKDLLNAWWIPALALNLILLVRGRWTRATRLLRAAIALFGAGVILYIVFGGQPVADPQLYGVSRLVRVVLGGWAFGVLAGAVTDGYFGLWRARPNPPD